MATQVSSNRGVSGQHAEETLVELTVVVENRLAEIFGHPGHRLMVGVVVVTTAEDLITVAGGIKEIDGLPVGQAMAGRADINRSIGHRDQVSGTQDLLPAIQIKGGMVELALLRMLDESDVVRFHRHGKELGNAVTVVVQNLLGQMKAQYIDEQVIGGRQFIAVQQTMVETYRPHATQIARPGFRIDVGDAPLSGVLLVCIQLEEVPARGLEAQAAAAALELFSRNVFHRTTPGLQVFAQLGEGGIVDDLEAHEIHARLIIGTEYHGELVDFGPGLEVDPAPVVAVHLDQPHQIRVMADRCIDIQHPELYVAGTHNAFFHDITSLDLLLGAGQLGGRPIFKGQIGQRVDPAGQHLTTAAGLLINMFFAHRAATELTADHLHLAQAATTAATADRDAALAGQFHGLEQGLLT